MLARVVGVLWLVPLAGFALEAASGVWGLQLHLRAWSLTLVSAGGAALLAALAGLPVGFVLARHRGAVPLWLTLLPLLFPPALAASTWMGLGLGAAGAAGCAAILASVYWPVVALFVAAALTRLPASELEAAALQLTGARTLRAVIWPRVRRPLGAGALVVFLLAASDFTVPATFAVPTVSHVIYDRLSAFEFAAGAWAAAPLAALAVFLAILLRRIPFHPEAGRGGTVPCGAPVVWAAATVWAATAAVPVVVCVVGARSPLALAKALSIHGEALAWSAGVAAATAAALVLWASLSTRRSLLEPLWTVGLVVPGIVAALGALSAADRLGVQRPLGDAGALLVFALLARFAAAAWLPLRDPVDRAQLEAAELAGLSRARAWRRIVWPSVRPRALCAGAVIFVLCLGEIGPSVLLSPPGRQTVVQSLFNGLHYGYDETVAALGLVLAGAAALAAGVGIHVGRPRHAAIGR